MICLQNQHTISQCFDQPPQIRRSVPMNTFQSLTVSLTDWTIVTQYWLAGLPFYKLHCSRLNMRSPCWCTTWECIWDHGLSSLIYQVDGHCVLQAPIACCQALHLLVAGRSQLLVHVSGTLCQRRLSSSSVTDVVLSASQVMALQKILPRPLHLNHKLADCLTVLTVCL